MFFPKSDPAKADPGRFTALRVSLNTPVVSTEELSSGPARAAIVQFWNGDRCAIEIRLRAAADGRIVVYDFDGPMEAPSDVDHAFEAALNFSEGMGFLFDEDVLSGDDTMSRARVAEAWTAFEAGRSLPVSPRAAARADVLGEPGDLLGGDVIPELDEELVLTDLAPGGPTPPVSPHDAALAEELASDWNPVEDEGVPKPVVPKAPPAPAPPARPAPPGLSKFRGHAEKPAAEPPRAAAGSKRGERRAAPKPSPGEDRRGKTLGRLPLVKRSPEGARPKPSLLVRILGAF